ncbi:hypothetical protein ES703_82713 [subsurface metagenome]
MEILRKTIPIFFLILVSLYPLIKRPEISLDSREPDREDSKLPTSARDVIVLVVDFSQFPGDALDYRNLKIISKIDKSVQELEGLRRHSSLIGASIVKAQQDEILVVHFITLNLINNYDKYEILKIKKQYYNFPEIWPYLSADFMTCVFYLEPGRTYPSHRLIEQIEHLQEKIRKEYGITFEFTGLRPIKVFIERYLTWDILYILPILFLFISTLYYVVFGNIKVLLLSWFVKVISTTFAFGCYLFVGGGISPLVILIPTFNVGLLSDYLIHMFYHIQGHSGLHSSLSARRYLLIPLSLTASTSIIGFQSLMLLRDSSHILLACLMGISIFVTYLLTLWWIPSVRYPRVSFSSCFRLKFQPDFSNFL